MKSASELSAISRSGLRAPVYWSALVWETTPSVPEPRQLAGYAVGHAGGESCSSRLRRIAGEGQDGDVSFRCRPRSGGPDARAPHHDRRDDEQWLQAPTGAAATAPADDGRGLFREQADHLPPSPAV